MQEDSIQNALAILLNTKVNVLINGKLSLEGILLDVQSDHFVIDTDRDVFYISLQSIRAISKDTKDFSIYTKHAPYINKKSLLDVLKDLKSYWITITNVDNESINGVLSDVIGDFIVIINESKMLFIPKNYISAISSAIPVEQVTNTNHSNVSNLQLELPKKNIEIVEEMEEKRKDLELPVNFLFDMLNFTETGLKNILKEEKQPISVQRNAESFLNNDQLEIDVIDNKEEPSEKIAAAGEPSAELSESLIEQFDEKKEAVEREHASNIESNRELPESEMVPKEIIDEKLVSSGKMEVREELPQKALSNRDENTTPVGSEVSDDQKVLIELAYKQRKKKNTPIDTENVEKKKEIIENNPSSNLEFDTVGHIDGNNQIHLQKIKDRSIPQINPPTIPIHKMSPREEKEMLANQYYALMQYAYENSFKSPSKAINANSEKFQNQHRYNPVHGNTHIHSQLGVQFVSLMNHAEKMFRHFKDEY